MNIDKLFLVTIILLVFHLQINAQTFSINVRDFIKVQDSVKGKVALY